MHALSAANWLCNLNTFIVIDPLSSLYTPQFAAVNRHLFWNTRSNAVDIRSVSIL